MTTNNEGDELQHVTTATDTTSDTNNINININTSHDNGSGIINNNNNNNNNNRDDDKNNSFSNSNDNNINNNNNNSNTNTDNNNTNNNNNNNSTLSNSATSSTSAASTSSTTSTTSTYTRLIDYFIVCGLNRSIVVNHADRPYQAEILDRYPLHNHDNAPLPSHYWMFCFPKGLMLRESMTEPTLSMFCLTEFDGARFYASSLIYHIPIPKERNESSIKTLYKPVSINLLSRFPCYDILRNILRYLYRSTRPGVKLGLPIERIISNIIHDLPRPIPGYKITFNLPYLPTPKNNNTNNDVILPHPETFQYLETNRPNLPNVDISFKFLFNCIGIQNVLKIFSVALHERKILFFSSNETLLTTACETIAHILYPFQWPHVFIPILPNILIDFLQAPTPLIVGMYNSPKNLEIEFTDITVVNLDQSSIHVPSGITIPTLPEKEYKLLENRLSKILYPEMYNIHLAFPSATAGVENDYLLDINSKIRSCFLSFFLSFFHNVNEYRYLLRKYPKPITSFNTSSFLIKHNNTEVVNFLTSVLETSAVTSFLDQNISTGSFFYYICKQHERELTLNANTTFYDTIIKTLLDNQNHLNELEYINSPSPDDSPVSLDGAEESLEYSYQNGMPELNEANFSQRSHFSVNCSIIKPKPFKPSQPAQPSQQPPQLQHQASTIQIRRESLLKSPSSHNIITNSPNSGNITSSKLNSDQELLKEFIQKYTEMIFEDETSSDTMSSHNSVDLEQQNLLLNLFTLAKSREYFVEALSAIEISHKKVLFFLGNWRLFLLVEIIKKIFNECDHAADFKTASLLLARINDIYYSTAHNTATQQQLVGNNLVGAKNGMGKATDQDSQLPLCNHFLNLALWRNTHFWESSFFDHVQSTRKDKLTPIFHDYLFDDWELYNGEKQKQLVETEENILFSILSSFAYQMIRLKVSTVETSRFVSRMASLTSLNEDHVDTLEELVERIYKAHAIESSTLPQNTNSSNVNDTSSFNKSDIKYFTGSVRRNIEIEKEGAKQIYTKLIENKRKKEKIGDASLNSHSPRNSHENLKDAHSSSNQSLLTAFQQQQEKTIDKKDGYTVTTLKGNFGVSCLAIHTKPKCIISGDSGGFISIWNYEDGEFLQKLNNHKDSVTCLGTGDYDVFASGSRDKTLRIWNYDGGSGWKCTSTLQEHTAEITCLEMKRNNILTGSYDSTMNLWDVRTNRRVKAFTGHVQHILSIALHSDAQVAVSTSSDTTARVWDLRTLKCLRILNAHNDWVTKAIFDPTNAKTLFTGGFDCMVKMWDIGTGDVIKTFSGHAGGINCLAYNPTTSTLISGSGDGFLKSWDVRSGFSTTSFKGHRDEILSILYEDDTLITSSNDQTIRVWNVNNGSCIKTLRGHSDWIKCLASPKMGPLNRFISASWDSTIKIWDLDQGGANNANNSGTGPMGSGNMPQNFKKSGSFILNGSGSQTIPINKSTIERVQKQQNQLKKSNILNTSNSNLRSSGNNNHHSNNNGLSPSSTTSSTASSTSSSGSTTPLSSLSSSTSSIQQPQSNLSNSNPNSTPSSPTSPNNNRNSNTNIPSSTQPMGISKSREKDGLGRGSDSLSSSFLNSILMPSHHRSSSSDSPYNTMVNFSSSTSTSSIGSGSSNVQSPSSSTTSTPSTSPTSLSSTYHRHLTNSNGSGSGWQIGSPKSKHTRAYVNQLPPS